MLVEDTIPHSIAGVPASSKLVVTAFTRSRVYKRCHHRVISPSHPDQATPSPLHRGPASQLGRGEQVRPPSPQHRGSLIQHSWTVSPKVSSASSMTPFHASWLLGLVWAVLGVSATRHLTDTSLGKYGIFNQGLSLALPLANVLPNQNYNLNATEDPSDCNTGACNRAGGTLSTASVTYCDQAAPVAMCVCSGAAHDTNR